MKPTPEGESSKVKVKVRINLNGIFTIASACLVEKREPTQQEKEEQEETEEQQSQQNNGNADQSQEKIDKADQEAQANEPPAVEVGIHFFSSIIRKVEVGNWITWIRILESIGRIVIKNICSLRSHILVAQLATLARLSGPFVALRAPKYKELAFGLVCSLYLLQSYFS